MKKILSKLQIITIIGLGIIVGSLTSVLSLPSLTGVAVGLGLIVGVINHLVNKVKE